MNKSCPLSSLSDTFHLSNEQLADTLMEARANDPVFYLPDIDFWAVTKFEDVKLALGDTDSYSAEIALDPLTPFSPAAVNVLKERKFGARPTLSNNTTQSHHRIRRNTQIAFSPQRIKKLEPYIRKLVNDAVDSFETDGHADLVAQMVYELPALVLFRLLGVPDEDVQQVKSWADDRLRLIWGRLDHDTQLRATHHLADYWDYCAKHVEIRLSEPADDLPSDMLAARDGDDTVLSIEDITNVVYGLLFAGHETTTNASANAVYTLLRNPGAWQSIVDNPDSIPGVAEEILRYRPSVVAWRRKTRKPVKLSGVSIPQDARLLLFLVSANRDEEVFSQGEEFDTRREDSRNHISFGFGQHFCLGAPLARCEIKIILEELSGRLPNLRLSRNNEYLPVESVQFRGPQSLLVEWE